jgi:CDP-glucose 4,6-dehydratase
VSFGNIYQGKRVVVTGHTGFKGSWLAWWLKELGAQVTGIALPAQHERGLFRLSSLDQAIEHVEGDIREGQSLIELLSRVKPRVIFHLAAQALVLESYRDPIGTMTSNIMGTVNILEAVRQANIDCAVIIVTSDKCYENREWPHSYRESDALGGRDIYSASKGACEIVTAAYRRSFFDSSGGPQVLVASARAGNVIGPGDWAADRIVPDIVRALVDKKALSIRNPNAVRPWQHVLEPLSGYLWLAALLLSPNGRTLTESWNFGPMSGRSLPRVAELARAFQVEWGDTQLVVDNVATKKVEAQLLQLDIGKAIAMLGWLPVWDFATTISHTAAGYKRLLLSEGKPAEVRKYISEEIATYVTAAVTCGNAWAVPGATRAAEAKQ